jgi:hypothetical protein
MKLKKYKLWDKAENKFFEPAPRINAMDIYITRNGELVATGGAGEVTSLYEIVEFTGLHDKNGKEIYELCEINNKYRVVYNFCSYVLQDISGGDIFAFEKNKDYVITREYCPLA